MKQKKIDINVDIILKCLWAIKDNDQFYFNAYGKEMIEKCIKPNLNKTNMKTQEEIEQLANEWSDDYEKGAYRDIAKRSYIVAYTQCQEDIVKELTEWIEITLSAKSKLGASDNVIEALLNVKYKIESLNKQD